MMFEHDDYSVDAQPDGDLVAIRGVMRLPTPAAFDDAFRPLTARLDRGEPLRVDLTALSFLNSSGIRALATLVLRAKARRAPLTLIGASRVPWQAKTLQSLKTLHDDLAVELR